MNSVENYIDILDTVVDNGRISAETEEEFQAQLKNEIEFEASERGLNKEEIQAAVEFAFAHASF